MYQQLQEIPKKYKVLAVIKMRKVRSTQILPLRKTLAGEVEFFSIKDKIAKKAEFFSFGTNDLTQFTLAIDRNNSNVQDLYNEMHPGVLSSLAHVIGICKKYGVETSICGQAGSKPEMAKFLLRQGIDSISVNADAAHKISEVVAEIERSSSEEVKRPQNVEKKIEKEKLEPEIEISRTENEFIVPQMQAVEEEEIEAIGEIAKEIQKQPNPVEGMEENVSQSLDSKKVEDYEDVMLKELGESPDYFPGNLEDKNNEIPPLNEAIPVESTDFESQEEKKEESDLTVDKVTKEKSEAVDDFGEEWKGES